MLIDELREIENDKTKQLFWLGIDARYGSEDNLHDDKVMIPRLLDLLGSATLYDCTMLTDTINAQWGEKPFRLVRDCFGPLPPYPTTAIELKAAGTRAIVLFEASKVTETPIVTHYSLREEALKRPGQRQPYQVHGADNGGPVPLPAAAWFVRIGVLIPLLHQGFMFGDSLCAYFCDSKGQLLTAPIANERINDLLNTQPDSPLMKLIDDVLSFTAVHISTAAMILNLMACKNVGSEPRLVDAKLQKARARRGKPPLTDCRVLNVTLPGVRRRTDGATVAAHAGEPLSLQTIPGQYRDYTEKGLFGKYKGVFWVPAHARGTAEAGEVKSKTYRAKPGNVTSLDTQRESV